MSKPLRLRFTVLLVVVLVLVFGYFIGIYFTRTKIEQESFPLASKWSTRLDGSVTALSIIGNDIALARTKSSLYALDTESGIVIWSQRVPWQAVPYPAVANMELVYVVGGNIIQAMRLVDGSVAWQKTAYGFNGIVLDVSESILVAKDGRGINVYDAYTGTLLQNIPACRTFFQAYIGDDSVFVPCDGILRLTISTGQISWWEERKGLIGNVGIGDGIMYLSQGKPNIVAFDLNQWKELWNIPMAIDGFERFDVYNDLVFFIDFSKICVLKQLDGYKQWCVDDVPYPQNPSVIGEVVYVFNGNHKEITALDLTTGKMIGRLKISNLNYFSTYRQLLVASNNVLIFSSGRDVFAFE